MQFGWLTLALSPSPEEDAARIEQQIEQVCYAEALGFSDVWLTEHYFTGESVYNDSLMFAAALAMRTSRIRLGFAVVFLQEDDRIRHLGSMTVRAETKPIPRCAHSQARRAPSSRTRAVRVLRASHDGLSTHR